MEKNSPRRGTRKKRKKKAQEQEEICIHYPQIEENESEKTLSGTKGRGWIPCEGDFHRRKFVLALSERERKKYRKNGGRGRKRREGEDVNQKRNVFPFAEENCKFLLFTTFPAHASWIVFFHPWRNMSSDDSKISNSPFLQESTLHCKSNFIDLPLSLLPPPNSSNLISTTLASRNSIGTKL